MNRRGFTLAELLVASGLSLLLLGLVVTCWLLAGQGWRKTYRQQTAQQSTLVVQTRLREDYRRAKPGSARIVGDVLSFLSYDDGEGEPAWEPTGQISWRCWIQYRWRNRMLERRQVALAAAQSEPEETPPAWASEIPGRRLGRELVDWSWLLRGVLLEIRLSSRYEDAESAAWLRVLPFLYQPD